MLSQEPLTRGELARRELLANPARLNTEIAKVTGVSAGTVARERHRLGLAGLISGRIGRTQLPVIPAALPERPRLDGAACASGRHDPGLWTSPRQAERAEAIRVCRSCPVLDACRHWALALPSSDSAIWAAMTHTERIAARRELAAAG